jgi:RNA polymerase sigma-70 factor, ECF subfamily
MLNHLVENLFRHQAGHLIATLTRFLGDLDLAEECVQEAMIRALELWPYRGIPEKPEAWLFTTARHSAIDRLRRAKKIIAVGESLDSLQDALQSPSAEPDLLSDDLLRLLFTCCHPALPEEGRVALTLKTVSGFGVQEIARAFLTSTTTIQQRLVRAKRKIRELSLPYELPTGAELSERRQSVLVVLYLMFNEGYTATDSSRLLQEELCREAIRVAGLLCSLFPEDPDVLGLLGLFHFQAARFSARTDAQGALLRLAAQDRSRFHQEDIQQGIHYTAAGMERQFYNRYVLQAAIAGCHTTASNEEGTDWSQILSLYTLLQELEPSPIVSLNRAVALGRVEGPAAAIELLLSKALQEALHGYYLLPATLASLYNEQGKSQQAIEYYQQALISTNNQIERQFLQHQLSLLTT